MVPVEQLFRRFPRMVRDVAQHRKKQVALVANGLDTELDKSILDNMAEPLTHLLRNAVDHGIETAEERVKAGKPAEGTIRLNAYHQGNQIVLEVSDDGRGINTAKVLSRAIERGLIEPEEAQRLKEPDIHQFLFHPGFSTADQVTEISGRGVGLDVVQSVMNRLKGTVTVESRPGQGTTFLLRVPLTLAIIKALMFQVENHLYAVPLGVVVEIARMSEADVHRVDQSEVVQLRDSVLTLLRLGFRPIDPAMPRKLFVIVINVAGQKFGLAVDQLAGEEELVIKALDDRMVSTELVSGASILGDGTVVLILNLPAVVERLLRLPAAGIARNPFLQMLRTSGGTGRGVHA
jgi:two-component system chemotaxis sensor kinase CheA